MLIFIILLFYYILNIIKTKKYIQLSTIILYIIIFIIDYCSLDFIEFKDWDKLGYGIAFFAEVGIILIFMMLLNFILFIIKKQKKLKINSRVKNIFINKKVEISIIILIIVLVILLLAGIAFLVWFFVFYRKKGTPKKKPEPPEENDDDMLIFP